MPHERGIEPSNWTTSDQRAAHHHRHLSTSPVTTAVPALVQTAHFIMNRTTGKEMGFLHLSWEHTSQGKKIILNPISPRIFSFSYKITAWFQPPCMNSNPKLTNNYTLKRLIDFRWLKGFKILTIRRLVNPASKQTNPQLNLLKGFSRQSFFIKLKIL